MSSISASEIVRALGGLTGEAREHEIIRYGEAGNLPAALWRFVTVTSTRKDARGKEHTFSYDVSFDFFSLGVDTDYIRIPMWPITAQRLLDAWQCTLPTPRMVEQIHKQSVPIVMPTTSTARDRPQRMRIPTGSSTPRSKRRRSPIGTLISGHRKDVVISKGLHDHPRQRRYLRRAQKRRIVVADPLERHITQQSLRGLQPRVPFRSVGHATRWRGL
jgi:hypothetical protein